MKLKKLLLFLFLSPLYLFSYQGNQAKVVENMINKQEQIVILIEDYIMSGVDITLNSTTNKYNVDREKISKYYNINPSFFNNISNESCGLMGTICSNSGGLEFTMVEKNNKYIGVEFKNIDVYGNKCPYCQSLSFQNLYKNIIIGDRIKIVNNESVFYPLKRTVLDLFTKVEIYYSMYGDSLHIGSTPPKNNNKVWVDIRGSIPIERFWYNDIQKWMEKTSNAQNNYVNKKDDLLKLPKVNGSKVKVLSDNGMTKTYSYNDVYKTNVGCQNTNPSLDTYDQFCGWLKVITGLDDYDFIINGVQLANE